MYGHSWSGNLDRAPQKIPQDCQKTVFAASSPTPTPLRAVKFGDAPCRFAAIVCTTTLRAYNLRARRPRSALQGRLAPTQAVSAHSESLNFQSVIPPK